MLGAAAALAWGWLALAAVPAPSLELQPGTLKPGDALLVTVRGGPGLPSGSAGRYPLKFFPWKGAARAVVGLSDEEHLGELPIRVDWGTPPAEADGGVDAGPSTGLGADGGYLEVTGTAEVIEPGFPAHELSVDPKFIKPPPAARRQIAEDKRAIAHAYARPFRPPLFEHNFTWPRPADFTSHFGERRLFNGKRRDAHFGTDLEGQIGDPVIAANDGIVTMARECYASGNTVIVYHGADLYTAYFHLSRMDVHPGQAIRRGESIGLVGNTGRVTGPHLHFGVKLGGRYVNAESLLTLDFE